MRLVGTTRLFICTVLLGIAVFAASWTVGREFAGDDAKRESVSTAVRKLLHGELFRDARPPRRDDRLK